MEIIPAIDLRQGRCVRLYQGDYNEETVFSDDPLSMALHWVSLGAMRLHVIDLDGAVTGELHNLEIITQIASAALVPVQVGGGVRNMETIEDLLKAGVERIILSTAAVDKPNMLKEACQRFGESIVVSIDARGGYAAVCGWRRETELEALKFAKLVADIGVRRFIYTDISRDGTLTEPNFSAVAELIDVIKLPVIASGGISTLTHLKMLKKLGAEGAIVGKALYTGDIDLKKALAAINQEEAY